MRFPAYILLPIFGALVLTVAVLGSWLWPAPTAPSPSLAPPTGPVATQAPVPSPAPRPPLDRPAVRPTVAMQPVAGVPSPPARPPLQVDMSPEARVELKQRWSALRGRAAELAMRGLPELERQRAEAQARGDQEEFQRLDAIIRQQRERAERIRMNEAEAPSERPELPQKGFTGPPVE